MAIVELPPPVRRGPKGTALGRMLDAENFAALAALYPAALAALSERLTVAKDVSAAREVLRAVLPSGRLVDFDGDVTPAGILRALSTGKISALEASQVAAAVKATREVEALDALAERVERIERALRLAAVA